MPPRIPFLTALANVKPTTFLARAISSTARSKNPRSRPNTASTLLSLDDPPRHAPGPGPAPGSGSFPGGPGPGNAAHARPRTSTEEIQRLIARTDERYSRIKSQRADIQKRAEEQRVSDEYMAQMPRHWREGDVFTPHDLSGNEMRKWRKWSGRKQDVLDALGLNPLDHYRNFTIISDFTTSMGHIQHSKLTGLRPVNQRKVAKAVRRVMGMGIHPSVHRHPELLQMEWRSKRSPR